MRAGAGPGAESSGSDAKSAKRPRSDPSDADEDEDDSNDVLKKFVSNFDYKQESRRHLAPKKSRKPRMASEADGKIRKISSIFAPK